MENFWANFFELFAFLLVLNFENMTLDNLVGFKSDFSPVIPFYRYTLRSHSSHCVYNSPVKCVLGGFFICDGWIIWLTLGMKYQTSHPLVKKEMPVIKSHPSQVITFLR
jgi:hypothetical protein